jgi:quinol---cytochrome c reductase iron-sulfur subunit, bacillus type
VEPKRVDEKPEHPALTVWPIGFAVGVACLLVGLIVSWWVAAIGGAIALVFGALWIADVLGGGHRLEPQPAAPGTGSAPPGTPSALGEPERFPRNRFLEGATLGLGAVIGAVVTIPPVVLALLPPFLKQSNSDIDVGPISDYPEGQWVVTTFLMKPEEVYRRTAYIRNNGTIRTSGRSVPSFTIISNRCAHLGCPVQPNGLVSNKAQDVKTTEQTIMLIKVQGLSGFGCPCHGGQYDSEGNRTAGPPVRGLDRYEFSIKKGRLYLGKKYSVSRVDNTGANAEIHSYKLANPGVHVDGVEQILYPWSPNT